MDIGAMSMALNQGQVKQQASMSVMKQAVDQGEQQGEFVNKMLDISGTKAVQQAAEPHKGSSIDVSL
ncbi:Putative motility protein [Alteribacillus persepolensis]|uniref:Putative motility protein n=1 Tax=Alteribacillus persepolensis TaxID=568899 RepID=A0A1G8AFS3_9BACI|nr:YjfB family protein [Alteribacillus persepolensis]SDH19814.1 Putative motility protein [Alteribacillus persepolensis]